ncbi:MAG TPA: YdeI/OmpD-associated family protein [Thermoanaerobaculia bacterium]|nr:YdeI/OmpD-associated family protein [Thermoanaerobaculia bacterium]
MPKTDPRIDAYIESSREFARPILRHLRELVHEACPEAEETLKWRSPTWMYGGKILCGMAAFKEHAAFIFWHRGMVDVLGKDGDQADTAMGSLGRLTSLKDVPSDRKMTKYIRQAADLTESGVPSRPRQAKKSAPAAVPDDLQARLKKNRAAAATFEKFPPGARKEYIQWITEAKQDATRKKRLDTTIEWLAEGKRRNWKYENC